MIKTFPDKTKLKIWHLHFKTSKRFDPKAPMEYFIRPLMDMGVQILTKDEHFFKKEEYVGAVEGFSEQTGLVDIWDSTTPEVKDSIWGYIQSLYVIAMNGIGETEKLGEIVASLRQQ